MSCFGIVRTMRIVIFVILAILSTSSALAEEERISDAFFKEGYWYGQQGHDLELRNTVFPDIENGTGVLVLSSLGLEDHIVHQYKVVKQFEDRILLLRKTFFSDHRILYNFFMLIMIEDKYDRYGNFRTCSAKDTRTEDPLDRYKISAEEFEAYQPFNTSKYETLFPKFFATDGQDESEISCSTSSVMHFSPFGS